MFRRSQTAPVQSDADDEDRELELPHELVGQYVDLGQRRAAVRKMLERAAGAKQRVGALTYDSTIIPDIREWLKAKCGGIAGPAPGSLLGR